MKIPTAALGLWLVLLATSYTAATDRPNVVLIVCDDLNDYIESLGGHPQAQTPNIERLSKSGVCFAQAHCNIPICAPLSLLKTPSALSYNDLRRLGRSSSQKKRR